MKIIGTGSALPKKSITNFDLEKVIETSDEWIQSRTGIAARHIVDEETTTSLSIAAAKSALEAAGETGEDLDMIIAATLSPENIIPMLSCEVQAALGATKAIAFDLNAACSGFLFSLSIVHAYMQCGMIKKALVIGAENLSKMMNWEDRGTCVLFGDGAGAVVVTAEEGHVLGLVQGSDGASGMALTIKNRPVANPFLTVQNPVENPLGYIEMDGQAVYKFAVKTVPQAIMEALEQANLTPDDIDTFVLHQANIRIIESVAKRLKQPMEKFPTNLQECGNISAGSIPVLLDRVVREGKIKKGDTIVLSGFGAGLTWGALVMKW